MKKIVAIIFTLAVFTTAGAQSVTSLGINPDARSGGMGEAGLALEANHFSIYQTTAAISLSDSRAAIGYSMNWRTSSILKNNNLHTVSGFYRINDRHAIGAGFRYFSTPKQVFSGKNFTPNDLAIDLGYSFAITDYLGVGANVRYVRTAIAPNGGKDDAFAADLSLFFKKNRWSAALAMTNLGTEVDYGGADKYDMPAWLKIGGAREFRLADRHMLTGSVEAGYMFMPSKFDGFQGGVGIEYMYNNLVAIRGGYRFGEKSTTGEGYGTVGLGLHYCNFVLDASFILGSSNNPVDRAVRLALGYKF